MDTIRHDSDLTAGGEHSMKDRLIARVSRIQPMVRERVSEVKPKIMRWVHAASSKTDELRRNPAVLGGVAGAAGLAVGLLGRYVRHRAHAPRLIIIETIEAV